MPSLINQRLHTAEQIITQLRGAHGDAVLASGRRAYSLRKRVSAVVAGGNKHEEVFLCVTAQRVRAAVWWNEVCGLRCIGLGVAECGCFVEVAADWLWTFNLE